MHNISDEPGKSNEYWKLEEDNGSGIYLKKFVADDDNYDTITRLKYLTYPVALPFRKHEEQMVKTNEGELRRSPRKQSIHTPLAMKGNIRKSSERVAIRAKAYKETETNESRPKRKRSIGHKIRGTRQTENVRQIIIGKKDQYRSSLVAFLKMLPELKSNGFGQHHEDLLKKTPFWTLYKSYNDGLVTEALYSESDRVLMKLIRCFDKEEKAFRIGGRIIEFTPMHVSHLLGLPNDGIQLKLHTKEGMKAEYGKRYFAGLRQLDLTHVKHALKLAVRGKSEENISDTVRLICLYLCTTLLFANIGNSIAWFIHNWMDDLEKMNGYNWSQVVHEWLIDDMIKKEDRPSSVTGCAIVLLFWLSEVTTLIEPIEDRQNMQPGFLRWNISQLTPLLLNADFSILEIRATQDPVQDDDPLQSPDTSSPRNKGKRGARSKKRSSSHKTIKTVKFKVLETPNKAGQTNETIHENEVATPTKEQSPVKSTPGKSDSIQKIKTHPKKKRRLRLRHLTSPTNDSKTDDTMDSCLDDFPLEDTKKAEESESSVPSDNADKPQPKSKSREDTNDELHETEPTDMHFENPCDADIRDKKMAELDKEYSDDRNESILDKNLEQATNIESTTQGGDPSTNTHGNGQSALDLQIATLPNVYERNDVQQHAGEDNEPKTPVDSDSDGLNKDDEIEGIPLQYIGWRPAYDVAYVKRLEFDRANLASRDLQHSQLVKGYKFQMESSRDYHRSIERTNELHELRIERLMRELRRERANNSRIQQENVSLWRKVVSLQMEVPSRDRALAQPSSGNNTSCVNDLTVPSFEILSQGFNETSSTSSNTNPQTIFARIGNDPTIEELTKKLNSTRAKLALCETQLQTLQQEKLKTVTEL
ncbi:hypothetical protein LguiB_013298 [Lonicera macranthoides]